MGVTEDNFMNTEFSRLIVIFFEKKITQPSHHKVALAFAGFGS